MSEQYWNQAAECAPLHETEHLQSLRLSRVIRKVYDNVAYYRAKMDEMGVTLSLIHI